MTWCIPWSWLSKTLTAPLCDAVEDKQADLRYANGIMRRSAFCCKTAAPASGRTYAKGRCPLTKRKWIVGGVTLLVLLLVLGLFGGSLYFINEMFVTRVERLVTTPQELGLPGESISVTSADGMSLKAWWVPAESPRGVVVVLHGLGGQDASTMLGHAGFLRDAGYAVLILDMRAHGRSGGERIGLAFEEPRDVAAALDWIAAQPDLAQVPVALLGVSMGGATAIRTAAIRPDVDAVISVSAYASVDSMIHDTFALTGAPDVIIRIFTPFVRLAFRTMYGVWPDQASPLADIVHIPPRPVLIAHGDAERQVAAQNA